MAEGPAHASRGASAAALAAVLAAAALRFAPFLAGGTVYRRDAGFFFVPWRTLLAESLARRELPLWNDAMSGGRAFAADPNAAVFWPLSPLVAVLGPSLLAIVGVFAVLAVFFFALRALGASSAGSAAGTLVLLFSGVVQAFPLFATTCAAAAPLPLAFASIPGLGADERGRRRRALALAALAFGLSALGGEPAVTLTGAAGFAALALASPARARTVVPAAGALALGVGIAAVQALPAAAELARSARGAGLAPEHGALFWSVRPARLLTLLEPRLAGDPAAGLDWGARASDASGPYFDDLALGVLPLVFAAAAWATRRGRAALLLAAAAAVLSFGRFLPGYALVGRAVPFVRYPEKWWVLATFALAAAAALGLDAILFGEGETKERARRILLRTAWGTAALCGALLAMAVGAEDFLRRVLWAVGLGAGDAPAAAVAGLVRGPLLMATCTLAICAAGFSIAETAPGAPTLLFTFKEKLRNPKLQLLLVACLFLPDAARRVAGTCPAGPRDLYTRVPPDIALVRSQAGAGRFYDDGADDRATAERRTREAGGLDRLRPETGVVFGLRYFGENDVDRMTPAPAHAGAAALAALPWGEEKARRLRAAGVTVVRTAAPGPDPVATEEIGRFGGDRLVKIAGARPEFALLPEGEGGDVTVLERRPARVRLRVRVALPAAVLAIGRTFDPSWRARADGAELTLRPADGHRTAAELVRGVHDVTLSYENPLFAPGGLVTAASLLAAAALAVSGRGV